MAAMTLDTLISESGRQTGIGAAAEPLTRELLQMMTGAPGGLAAFLERFRSAGLGSEIASFLGGRNDTPLSARAVDTAIGESTVAGMAQRAGLAPAAASTALGFEIPKLIGMLTPGGRLPTELPSEVRSFVGEREPLRPVMSTVRETEQVRPVAATAVRGGERRGFAWLWGLVALAILAGIVWTAMTRSRTPAPVVRGPTAPTMTVPAAPATPHVPAPSAATTTTVSALNQELSREVLNFPTGSATLPAAAAPALLRAAHQINSLPAGSVIEIGGHTDNTGAAAANMSLSQERAEAVRTALIQDGVAPAMLTARGYGDSRPVASNDTADGRSQNRRTEFRAAGVETSATTTTTTTTTR